MHTKLTALALVAFTALAACGETTAEQAIIGAGAGAATAVVLDGNVAAGAIVGAGANVLACTQGNVNC